MSKLYHDGGPYHIETSPLTCHANQSTGFYMIGTSVMKELIYVVLNMQPILIMVKHGIVYQLITLHILLEN